MTIRQPKLKRIRARKAGQNFRTLVILVVFLTPMVVNSWTQFAIADASTNTTAYSGAQESVYSAMYWLRDNTLANSTYLSISDWRFSYTQLIFGRTTNVVPIFTDKGITTAARSSRSNYLIVTLYITVPPPSDPFYYPWNRVQKALNLTLVYSNDDVKIFKLPF